MTEGIMKSAFGAALQEVCAVCLLLVQVVYHWLRSIVLAFVPTPLIAKKIAGQTVLVTGSGSGIGRLIALEFARHNCRLALWDVNDAGNAETANMCRSIAQTVARTYNVDVSDRSRVYQAAAQVTSDLGRVDIVVNNAGIVTGHKFLDCPDPLVEKTLAVNTMSHFWTVKAFLPAMIARNHGHIVNVASSAGLIGVSGLADYCSSKFAAIGFDESLRYELRAQGKDGVNTTVVCPYLINTGMFNGCQVKFPWLLNALDPEVVADEVVQAVQRNQEMLVLPRLLNLLLPLKGILPTKCTAVISDYMGNDQFMNSFKGKSAS